MSEEPKCSRFRITLRTLFVVLAIFGIWIGYEVHWLRNRREVTSQSDAWPVDPATATGVRPKAPGMLSYLGENGYGLVEITFKRPTAEGSSTISPEEQAEIERVRRLFPEATVRGKVEKPWEPKP